MNKRNGTTTFNISLECIYLFQIVLARQRGRIAHNHRIGDEYFQVPQAECCRQNVMGGKKHGQSYEGFIDASEFISYRSVHFRNDILVMCQFFVKLLRIAMN